jgi:transposase
MKVSIDREVKLAYVQQILTAKISASAAAKELGVHESSVYTWVKKYQEDPANALPGSGKQKPEDEENRKLREKVKNLEAEVEFLKNVSAYFASGHGKSTRS